MTEMVTGIGAGGGAPAVGGTGAVVGVAAPAVGGSVQGAVTNDDLAELIRALSTQVKDLSSRVEGLENELASLKRQSDENIPEDVLIAISAAVSAYLGNRGKVRAVHFSRHRTWAAQGRQAVQRSQRL